MKLEGKNWIRFMISVALACTAKNWPSYPLKSHEAAGFVRDVLHIALGNQNEIAVETIPYPVTTKVPLLLYIGSNAPRLFWYYPTQSQDEMSDHLADLVSELQIQYAALATA